MATLPALVTLTMTPPQFCEYAGGPCDQDFAGLRLTDGFAIYTSDPAFLSETIEGAIQRIRQRRPGEHWGSWKDLSISGQIIFCRICKAIRSTKNLIADVTALNPNVLFEIGYALGLGIAIQPIRDSNYVRDQKSLEELGMLDTFGYSTFENSDDLAEKILSQQPQSSQLQTVQANREQPLYLMRSHAQTEGMVRLMSALKKSGLRFRAFDPKETSRLSLHDATKHVQASLGVIVHLISPDRSGATVNNARAALVGGIAMAQGKRLLMLQEGEVKQPIDFRDVIKSYRSPSQVSDFVIPLIKSVVEELQESRFVAVALPLAFGNYTWPISAV